MHIQKSKKILFYFFLFLIIGTLNNKSLNNLQFPRINEIKVSGLSEEENFKILQDLRMYKVYNLFFLKKFQINEFFKKYNYLESFFVQKKYPSSLDVKLVRAKPLAYITKNNQMFYIGSNGNLIEIKNQKKNYHISLVILL